MNEQDQPPRPPASPEEEARRVAAAHESYRGFGLWETAGGHDSPYGTAWVCRVRPGRVLHVIGASEMAQRLREIYARSEVVGWSLQPMPDTRTLLSEVRGRITEAVGLGGRGYNQIDRFGFVYAEEVQACPDDALLDIHNLGASVLSRIRNVLPYTASAPVHNSTPVLPHRGDSERVVLLEQQLTAAARARNHTLVDGLAASAMPAAALDKIIASLNAEPTPPADDLVELLLDTAGLGSLLALYRATHQKSGDDA